MKRASPEKEVCGSPPHYLGHRKRLRERFIAHPSSLPDYEVLELILYWIYPRQDVKPKAKSLLSTHGSLAEVLNLSQCHLGSTLFYAFQLISEIARRMLLEDLFKGPLLNNSLRVIEYCHLTMAHLAEEHFRLFFLNRKYGLLHEELHQKGTLDQVPLYPREVLKRALSLNASNLIMVHNHPSGDPTPSTADIELTHQLKTALLPFQIQVIDHFIIGKQGYYSFREKGLLDFSRLLPSKET